MYAKVSIVALMLIASAWGKVIQVRNGGGADLWVEVDGQNGILLPAGQMAPITVGNSWRGSIRAGDANCKTTNCAVRTRADFNLKSVGLDQYSVNLEEGFNRRMKITAIGGASCQTAVCAASINKKCPVENRVVNALQQVVACKPTPLVFAKMCPLAMPSPADSAVVSCTSNTYMLLIN